MFIYIYICHAGRCVRLFSHARLVFQAWELRRLQERFCFVLTVSLFRVNMTVNAPWKSEYSNLRSSSMTSLRTQVRANKTMHTLYCPLSCGQCVGSTESNDPLRKITKSSCFIIIFSIMFIHVHVTVDKHSMHAYSIINKLILIYFFKQGVLFFLNNIKTRQGETKSSLITERYRQTDRKIGTHTDRDREK